MKGNLCVLHRRPVLSSANALSTMANTPTASTANAQPIINPYWHTPHTVLPTVIPTVNIVRVLPSTAPAFIDNDTLASPPPAATTTNSPVDSPTNSTDFVLDLSVLPSLLPSRVDNNDDKANNDDDEADKDAATKSPVAQQCPPQQADIMHNVALGMFFPRECLLIPPSLYSLMLTSLSSIFLGNIAGPANPAKADMQHILTQLWHQGINLLLEDFDVLLAHPMLYGNKQLTHDIQLFTSNNFDYDDSKVRLLIDFFEIIHGSPVFAPLLEVIALPNTQTLFKFFCMAKGNKKEAKF
jgi:hypothetical protein